MKKLIPKSKLTSKKSVELDSLKIRSNNFDRNMEVLLSAQRCWDGLEDFRKERDRNIRYANGDQWSDRIVVDGKTIKEEDYIKNQGGIPLKNNLISRLVNTVVGVYRGQNKEPTCSAFDRDEQSLSEVMTLLLQSNWKSNRMKFITGKLFTEFLESGMVISKEVIDFKDTGTMDTMTMSVNPNNFFFDNNISDARLKDVSIIGEIHNLTFGTLCKNFASSREEAERLSKMYNYAYNSVSNYFYSQSLEEKNELKNVDFMTPLDSSLCRVIEVWKKEHKPSYRVHDLLESSFDYIDVEDLKYVLSENERRKKEGLEEGMDIEEIPFIEYEFVMREYWYYRFLSPYGAVLKEGESPYSHKSHPYTVQLYPFINGKIRSFVANSIDQQRYINRLITLNDFVIRASAKGALLIPEDCIPDGMTINDFAESWAKYDGTIVFKPSKSGHMPTQVSANSTNIGINEMLKLQLNLIEDITGVTGALQGKQGLSGTSAALYAQQQQNAASSLLDLLESFSTFIVDLSLKKVKNIQQFYDERRIMNIAGKKANGLSMSVDEIKDIEFELSITESAETPTYRMIANDFLMTIWKAGQINLVQLLENGNFPFADSLLQSIKAQGEAIENGQIPEPIQRPALNVNENNLNKAGEILRS